jgi:hypothetical protein
MSLHDYLDSFHRAIGKIEDSGFAESIDIKELSCPFGAPTGMKKCLVLSDGAVIVIGTKVNFH